MRARSESGWAVVKSYRVMTGLAFDFCIAQYTFQPKGYL
jgi:hypothetical protein